MLSYDSQRVGQAPDSFPGESNMKLVATASLVALGVAGAAVGQDPIASYPNKAIRIVVPFPAGGTADAMPRIVGEKLSAKWGQPVVVENRAGAAGNRSEERRVGIRRRTMVL